MGFEAFSKNHSTDIRYHRGNVNMNHFLLLECLSIINTPESDSTHMELCIFHSGNSVPTFGEWFYKNFLSL